MKARRVLAISLWIVVLAASAALAHDGTTFDCPEGELCLWIVDPPADPNFETMRRSGDRLILNAGDSGLVRIVYDGTTMYAQRVTLDEEARWGLLEERVHVTHKEAVVVAHQAEIAFDDERFVFEGGVHLQQRAGKPRDIWAERLEYDGDSGDMSAQGDVRLVEEGRTITAWALIYEEAAQRLQLEGDVAVRDDRGEMTADRMEILLDDEQFTGFGPGRLVLREFRASDAP